MIIRYSRIILGFLIALTLGCIEKPSAWYEKFKDFNETCLTPNTRYMLNSLDFVARGGDSNTPYLFIDSLGQVFSGGDVDFRPSNRSYPEHLTIADTGNPDDTLYLVRHGWTYCVDASLSTSLFLPLRKVSY